MTRYTGTAFIAVTGGDIEYPEARDSQEALRLRSGDSGVMRRRATKGYEARQAHFNDFLKSPHSWLFMMDADMIFPPDSLERLRDHGIPFVSGLYMRRNYNPIAPVWFEPSDEWPARPMVRQPERGKLHEIGASGWGCMLLHREVIEKTRVVLRGEPDILEDDMDVYPYDLAAIMAAIKGLETSTDPAQIAACVATLRAEIRPLKVRKDDIVGSDVRYPWFARQAGYKLYGDPDVQPGHILHYPLSPTDYAGVPAESIAKADADAEAAIARLRAEWLALQAALL